MLNILSNDLQISGLVLEEAYSLVVEANEAKGTQKVSGKIQKGESWVDPKHSIRKLLVNV
jgi:hypothetical protein